MSVTGTGSAGAGLLVRMLGDFAELAKEDRREASKDSSDQSQRELAESIKAAEEKRIAAKEDYYIQNLEGTIGQVPLAGKVATTVMTSGKQEQELLGVAALPAGPLYAPVGIALLASAQLRPQLRAANELDAAGGKTDPATDNALVNTFAFADRADRDAHKDAANKADIEAKKAGKEGSEAKTALDDAKKQLDELDKNMRAILEDNKRAVDKIQG